MDLFWTNPSIGILFLINAWAIACIFVSFSAALYSRQCKPCFAWEMALQKSDPDLSLGMTPLNQREKDGKGHRFIDGWKHPHPAGHHSAGRSRVAVATPLRRGLVMSWPEVTEVPGLSVKTCESSWKKSHMGTELQAVSSWKG